MFCNKCGHKFTSTDIAFCTQCGMKMLDVKPLVASEQKAAKLNYDKSDISGVENVSKRAFCTNCGHKFSNINLTFCTECGTKTPSSMPQKINVAKSNSDYAEKEKEPIAVTAKHEGSVQSKKDNVYLIAGIAASVAAIVVAIMFVNRITGGTPPAPPERVQASVSASNYEEYIQPEVLEVEAISVTVSDENQLRTAIANAGSRPVAVTLTANIDILSNFTIPSGVEVTLSSEGTNEFRLIATRDMPVIEIHPNATLTLENVVITRREGTTGTGIINSGTFIMNGGTITGNNILSGSGAGGVLNSGSFILNDGVITNNWAYVQPRWGDPEMLGNGGGVRSTGSFTMNGGIISNNFSDGGGVNNLGEFTMNNGTITNNNGVGVRNRLGTFAFFNGEISNNSIGGVLNYASFSMKNGIINNNSGSGVDNNSLLLLSTMHNYQGVFQMHGGLITGNSNFDNRRTFGGGVNNNGLFYMYGGNIEHNQSNNGGGVSNIGGIFTMNGGVIANNEAISVDVYLWRDPFSSQSQQMTHTGTGGGVYNRADFLIDGGWIYSNFADYGDEVHIESGTFNNNLFDSSMGAIGSPPPR